VSPDLVDDQDSSVTQNLVVGEIQESGFGEGLPHVGVENHRRGGDISQPQPLAEERRGKNAGPGDHQHHIIVAGQLLCQPLGQHLDLVPGWKDFLQL